jgi:hypothetical protein
MALAAFFTRRWNEAVELFTVLAERHPHDKQVADRLAAARHQQHLAALDEEATRALADGRWDDAIGALQQLASAAGGGSDVDARLKQAREGKSSAPLVADLRRLHAAGEWRAVIAAAEELAALDPKIADPDGLVASARAALIKSLDEEATRALAYKRWDEAVNLLQQLVVATNGEPEVESRLKHTQERQRRAELDARLRRQHTAGEWQAVIDTGAELAELDPKIADPDGLVTAARASLAESALAPQYKEALQCLDRGEMEAAYRILCSIQDADPHFRDVRALIAQIRVEFANHPPNTTPAETRREQKRRRFWGGHA